MEDGKPSAEGCIRFGNVFDATVIPLTLLVLFTSPSLTLIKNQNTHSGEEGTQKETHNTKHHNPAHQVWDKPKHQLEDQAYAAI
jgi:hypothetical protein